MTGIQLTRPSPEDVLDIHWRIGWDCSSKPNKTCTIDIDRGFQGVGTRGAFCESAEDEREGRQIILEFWDRESFRQCYRYARIWRAGGIGHRLRDDLGNHGGAA